MTLRSLLLVAGLAAALLFCVGATPPNRPGSAIAAVLRNLSLNPLGRYMSPAGGCRPVRFPGWEGFPTLRCTYRSTSGVPLEVVLLNPSTRQLATWYVTACRDAHARDVVQCAERIALVTTCQSGAQFPVAGYVDEGEIFTFRDGVTVRMTGLPSSIVPKNMVARDRRLVFHGRPAEAKRYARISSTTRSEFARFVGKPVADFAGLRWLDTVRRQYQEAWNSERNTLISARVAAAVSGFDRQGWDTDAGANCGLNWKKWPAKAPPT